MEVKSIFPDCNISASGGIRNGLDGVKAITLGASIFGMAGPILKVLLEKDIDAVQNKIDSIHEQVKIALIALNANTPQQLKGKPHVLMGKMKEWVDQRIN